MKKNRIGIIGGTRGMGRWFADYFTAKGLPVEVSGKGEEDGIPALAGRSDVLCVAVPIGVTVDTIRKAGPHVREDALLMDLTSVKVEPVRAMVESAGSEVIGLHPLFGPGVAALQGENIFICAARGKRWLPWLKEMLLLDGARLVETTPEKHDEMMAYVQVLTHLGTIVTGRVLKESGIDLSELLGFSTPAFRTGLAMAEKVFGENPRLYGDILAHNPGSRAVAGAFQRNLRRVVGFIDAQDADGLTRWIKEV